MGSTEYGRKPQFMGRGMKNPLRKQGVLRSAKNARQTVSVKFNALATVKMSLSPRPHIFMTMI
ncbi:hypothetical protein GALL_535820 [mine drainage metagenome]|uniref:Uncharacterized protein n=1 Tax=mine drainage metagenome TaxID=410659 RepID=A0A1J5NZZ5_9ZZZZ